MYSSSNHVYFPKLDLSLLAKRPTRDADTKFPCKLHKMLKDVEDEGFTHIISWHNDGKCFRVHEPEEFVEKILPRYFKKCKYRSFQRQLNLYGFHRITALKPFWESCYYHPDFSKDDELGCRKINRPLRRKSSHKADEGVMEEISRNSPAKPKDIDGFMMNSRHMNRKNVGMFPSPLFETQDTKTETPIVEDEESVKQLLYDSTYSEQALTRRNSYQDLCESIMGSDCEACKDGARLMNEIMEIDNFGFAI
ncbi:HSF-type DNA-binding protein [Nitzschia inconspicua]|uniref:HSF-type DNA-binding protein n=1 Tax=Nitzschia inconspicua TaxID=303405 RepID=A0A9K3L7E1_9STRA|nr:HSF-type DNA-binding protein [Nitzschia inconspicua]